MGCGASASRPPPEAESSPDKLAPQVTEQLAAGKAELPSGLAAPAKPKPAASQLPEAFAELASGSGGKLPRSELEACLTALGVRKSVLALALSPLEEMPADACDIAQWWADLNPRSRVVIESKLRGSNPRVLFALAYACAKFEVGQPSSSASDAELRETLTDLLDDDEKVSAALEGCSSTVVIAEWLGALPAETSTLVGQLLSGEDPNVDPGSPGSPSFTRSANVHSFSSASHDSNPPSPEHMSNAEAMAAATAAMSVPDDKNRPSQVVPEHDPLNDAVGVRASQYE